MRRFVGYIALVFTIIVAVVFNVTLQTSELNTGLEYGTGYEAVYRVDFEESTKSFEDIVDIITQRVEDAGVRNANVEAVSDEMNGEYQIRIKANSESADEFDYVLRSVESTGSISVSTVLNEGEYIEMEDPFVRGSAKVDWSGSTPFVSVEIKDHDAFKAFVDSCNEAFKAFNEKYNSDSEEQSSLEGVIVIWLDKTDADSYLEAFENENVVIQEEVKSKILSIIPTSYFQEEKDRGENVTGAKLLIDRYDFDQIQMVGESAHTIERLLNYDPQDYSLDRLYVQRVAPTFGNNAYNVLLIGLGIAVVLLAVYLVVCYGLSGLAGVAALFASLFLSLLVFNFFNYPVTTMVFLAFMIALILNACLIIPLLETYKDEIYKGKSAPKANVEAFRSTSLSALDTLVASLLVSVVTILISINQVKLLPIAITISTLVSYVVVRLLMRLMMWWLTNSKVTENPKLFMIKSELVPNLSKDEGQQKFNFMHKFDANKNGKKFALSSAIASGVCAIAILVMSLIPGIGTFNYTDEFKATTRLEVTQEVTSIRHVFDTKESVVDFFEKEYNLTPANVDINLVENVITDSSNRDDLPTIVYISVSFDEKFELTDVEFEQLEQKIRALNYGENAEVYLAKSSSTMPNFILVYSIITLAMFAVLPSIYYLVRYKYSYGVASLATVLPSAIVTIGLLTLVRIPTSPLVLMGIGAGLLIGALAQIPLFSKIKRLTKESKVKVTTFDQRKEIILRANKESLHISVKLSAVAAAVIIFLAIFAPTNLITVFGGMLISLLLVTLLTCFLLTPVYLMVEEKAYELRLKRLAKTKETRKEKGKKRLQKIKEAHKKVGSEPEESIIPGIND